mgnify:CR=1 FL=1
MLPLHPWSNLASIKDSSMTTDQRIEITAIAAQMAQGRGWSLEQAVEVVLAVIQEDGIWKKKD